MSPQPDHRPLRTIAPAKINLTFEILGKRADGYHEVRTVMQTLALADELIATPAEQSSLRIEGRDAERLSTADNLVAKAEVAVPPLFHASPVQFFLTKRIPTAAGLGGGSSDAAAALRLMQRLWALPDEAVRDAAASLGSDVSFFLRGGTQVAAGRGEILAPLPDLQPCTILLATPPIVLPNKTVRLYSRLTADCYTDGSATERLAARIRLGHPFGHDDYVNAFDSVADDVFPGLADLRHRFAAIVGGRPMLAGAGPSLFIAVPPHVSTDQLAAWCGALDRLGFLAAPTRVIDAEHATAVT
ncbi:MAG: 4-(cytidine 5'-diphospho)-2-C-methyl-D-erythritol kinase [Dehalococcoidia bacterium]